MTKNEYIAWQMRDKIQKLIDITDFIASEPDNENFQLHYLLRKLVSTESEIIGTIVENPESRLIKNLTRFKKEIANKAYPSPRLRITQNMN